MNENLLAGTDSVLSPERIMLGSAIMLLAATFATAAIASLVRRDRARLGPTTRRFCHAVSVGPSDRRLLESLSHIVGVPCAALLISRGCFDAAAVHASASEARRLAAIRERVFG
jgi:hypothetical protein